ncbi:GTPase IMAP family member 7-like [Mytilus edulis]|uniref:GTPase IMAP family member 7-like n=1 Tax=Mytilus edulis TaxID=6550 RepID=UPI0039EF8E0B
MALSQDNKTIHLVLLGYIGSGKSSTANTIVKRPVFKSAPGSIRITQKVQTSQAPFRNVEFNVIDTPGLEKESDFESIKQELKTKGITQSIVCALVVRIGRTSREEIKILDSVMRKKTDLLKNTIMIFTNAKELSNDDNIAADQTFDTWIEDMPNLKKLINDHKIQYLPFENVNASEEEKKSEVNKLLKLLNIPPELFGQTDQFCLLTPNRVYDEDKEETTIRVTKSQLQKQFGQAGLDFFEVEDRKQKQKQKH